MSDIYLYSNGRRPSLQETRNTTGGLILRASFYFVLLNIYVFLLVTVTYNDALVNGVTPIHDTSVDYNYTLSKLTN